MLFVLQGDGAPIKKRGLANTTESEELMQVPWTAHNGGHALTKRAESIDRDLDSLDGSDEDCEFVPYCVMPHVERLLQVRQERSMPLGNHNGSPSSETTWDCCPVDLGQQPEKRWP